MRVHLVTPAAAGARTGNRVSALRWARMLRELGHRVRVDTDWQNERADLLFALHARKSARAVRAFSGPVVLALTGTDLYHDLDHSAAARASVERADRLLVLQPRALDRLPRRWRNKAHVVLQSVPALAHKPAPRADAFEVAVVCHLRPVKDPLRCALAARRLPSDSRILVTHAGAALSPSLRDRARREVEHNHRYEWLGDQPRRATQRLIARARVLALTSRMEGGANVVSEAIVAGTPVISSAIDGSIGLLGENYPGYFPVGDTDALAELMRRAEADQKFYSALRRACLRLQPAFQPERERAALARLFAGL